jgi:hypothetical protein
MNRPHPQTTVIAILTLLLLSAVGFTGEENPVVLGVTRYDGEKYNVEFGRYDRMAPVYRQNGIEASLITLGDVYPSRKFTEDQLVAKWKQFHAILLIPEHEGVAILTPECAAYAKVVGAALARYVSEGGGLVVTPRPVRYPGQDDEKYWNIVFEPLGITLLHEGVFDKTRQFEGKTLWYQKEPFWYTQNIAPHPVTENVKRLCLPLHDFGHFPGLVALKYSGDWQVIVSGEAEAKSYLSGNDNNVDIEKEGTYQTLPPVAAVRTLGKGRIVSYPLATLFTGLNHKNPLWPDIVEEKGDVKSERPSDSMKMQMNAVKWAAQPAQALAEFGTFKMPPFQKVEFPKTVDWDAVRFGKESKISYADGVTPDLADRYQGVRGIMGAHTSYSDGQGTVAEYVAAAKAAGLSFIVFNDPLEQLTPETIEKLKADCQAVSDDTFHACPGIEFTDGIGNRWAFWGEKIRWPHDTFQKGEFTYKQWDGKRINHYGEYNMFITSPSSALLSYNQLRENGAHPENLWWFWDVLPLVYDQGKLVADNYKDYLFALRDLRYVAPSSFTRINTPADVAAAAGLCFTGYKDLPSAVKALNTHFCSYYAAEEGQQYMSQGPEISYWRAVNRQMELPWYSTRGAQRVKLKFAVRSEDGIAEVIVHDADAGAIRRFAANGEKAFAREFELAHDKQHYVSLEVVDTKGKKAYSNFLLVFCYKQGLFRCGDNLNILGPLGMLWHPDRSQDLPLAKYFANGEDFTMEGWDRGGSLCPMPEIRTEDRICFAETGGKGYPPRYGDDSVMIGKILKVHLASNNLQICSMEMTRRSERFDSADRPGPAFCSVPKDLGDLEYFERTHTMFAPMQRLDHFIIWNYRRRHEGSENYRGSLMWHEGEIRIKKDLTLTGRVPIPLLYEEVPVDLARNWGDTFVVKDADKGMQTLILTNEEKRVRAHGTIQPGGYAARIPSLVGYNAFFAPAGSEFVYDMQMPGRLYIGLGKDGQKLKAGTVIKYRFAIATLPDYSPDTNYLDRIASLMNLSENGEGAPVEVKTGFLPNSAFFLTAQAADCEAAFTAGPALQVIDQPFKVTGLRDNGCAAVYSSQRPWFRYIGVADDGVAYFQEPLDRKNDLWVGNVFVCDDDTLKLTLIDDGQEPGKLPFLELHNPGVKPVTTLLRSPRNTPKYGGMKTVLIVPPGASLHLTINDGAFVNEDNSVSANR